MTAADSGQRLMRPAAGDRQRHLTAAIIVTAIAGAAALGLVTPAIAFLAAGAGAGYSLSGSV